MSSREVFIQLLKEIDKAVRNGDPSEILLKLPTQMDKEEQKRRWANIGRLNREIDNRTKKIKDTKEFLKNSEENIKIEEEELKRRLDERISHRRAEYDRDRTLKQEYIDRLERERHQFDLELLQCTESYTAMNIEDMKIQFSHLFRNFSELLLKTRTNGENIPRQPSVPPLVKKEEPDSFDFDTFNNGPNGYGSFLSDYNPMFSSLNKTIMENVAKHGDKLGQDTITKMPPPLNLSSSGSKLFDEDPPLVKEENPHSYGKGKGPVLGRVAHKVPRKVPLNSSSGKKPIFSSSDDEDDKNNEKELVQKLKSIIPNDGLTSKVNANDLFSDEGDDDDDEEDIEKMAIKDPFEEDKDTNSSEEPQETSSTSDSSKTSESSDSEDEIDEFGSFNTSFPEGYVHPNPPNNEMQIFIEHSLGITDPENKRIEDNVMEEIGKLKVDVDPKIEEKRKRKEEKRNNRKKEKRKRKKKVATKSDEITIKKEEEDKPKKSKPSSSTTTKSSGKKRGRPADYETEVDWDDPKIPKVRLTKQENELSEKKKGNYGHYKSIPEYEAAIVLSGLCKYCGKRYKQCECKCFMGHSRKECGAFPDRKCNDEMKQSRHDGGFYVDATRKKVVNMIKESTTDAVLKKAHFKLARGYEIGYHAGKHQGWNLPSFMVQVIRWAIRHPDHDERCPVCMCKDMVRKSTYLVCYGCRNSGIIKPYFDTKWRNMAIKMEEKRKGEEKTKKRKRKQNKSGDLVTKKKKTK